MGESGSLHTDLATEHYDRPSAGEEKIASLCRSESVRKDGGPLTVVPTENPSIDSGAN